MYVISGATGHVGSAITNALLAAGAPVRALVRSDQAAQALAARGAECAVLDLRDEAALTRALEDATAFFSMLPFDLSVPDLDAYADEVVGATANAVRGCGIRHVVATSSGGADLPTGTGPVAGLHQLEEALRATGTVVTALRSQHFQEKVADVLDLATTQGIFPVFSVSADQPTAMVATRDMGVVAAQALKSAATESEAVDGIGPEYSERQVAALLGQALGRDLQVVVLEEQAWGPPWSAPASLHTSPSRSRSSTTRLTADCWSRGRGGHCIPPPRCRTPSRR